jgi:ATP-dependent DNA helicase RecG
MTSPGLLAEIYEQCLGGESIMIIDIPNSIKKPVFIKKDGIPNGIYLRAGSSTRRATPEHVEELMRENKRAYFDEETIPFVDFNILSTELIKKTFKRIDRDQLITEKVLMRSNINPEKYFPTITGILFFCHTPEMYIPEALIHCTRFSGTDGRNIIQSEEIQGTLETQIETSFHLVKSWLIRDYKLFNTKLLGKTIIPEEALREVIINAIIHRKYWIPGAVKIALYDNRLEIFSPGNFPGLMNIHHLGDGITHLRNPHLARIARRLGLVEKLGTGIKLILDSCRKMGIKSPEFQEGADSVKVIFNFLPTEDDALSEQDNLLALFHTRHEVRLSDVETYLNISRNTATRKLNQLIEIGKIKRQGKGPSVRYTRS